MLQRTSLWEIGKVTFDWWPDWRGKACAIIASGPTAKAAKVSQLRGRLPVLAIKECAIDLAPWADVAYGCDAAWWRHRRGLPDFKGVRVAWEANIRTDYRDVNLIQIGAKSNSRGAENPWVDHILMEKPGVIGAGRSSGFQAINLAAQFGAARILLVGFDMHDRGGVHYYGRNNWFKAGNPDADQFDRSRRALEANAGVLRDLNVEVANASPSSDLKCFRRMSIEQALVAWGL